MTSRRVVRALLAAAAPVSALVLAGCGGSGSAAPAVPTIQPAKTYHLAGFKLSGDTAGKPLTLSFVVDTPSGGPLTQYRRGSGPHTGIHLILVRSDLSEIIHRHPPVGADGKLTDTITFPAPGRYRAVIDVYPKLTGPLRNFQLFQWLTIRGPAKAKPLPPFQAAQVVDGYTFTINGCSCGLRGGAPNLHAIQAALMNLTVTGPDGKPAQFTPWYGALAHAIFFRAGSLDYFHTHICAPGASGCTSVFGGSSVTGTSATPGKLTVGVLVPVPGTWRLFLQGKVNGHVLTAPFTLKVAS